MWLTRNEDGTPTGKGFSKPYCYHIDQFESLKTSFYEKLWNMQEQWALI